MYLFDLTDVDIFSMIFILNIKLGKVDLDKFSIQV